MPSRISRVARVFQPRDAGARGVRARELWRLSARGAWGLADQATISASSFLSSIVLARELGPSGFGVFTLAYSVILLANAFQWSFITQPHNVLGATRQGDDYVRYTTATALSQATLTGFVGLTALGAAVALALASNERASLLLAFAAAACGWLLLEFVRRVLYTERRRRTAFAIDATAWLPQPLLIAVLAHEGVLTVPAALVVVGACSAVGFAIGAYLLRDRVGRVIDASAFRANWRFGKWLAFAMAGSAFFTYVYLFLVALVLGASAAGVIRAAQVVLGPLNVIVLSLLAMLPTHFAHIARADGVDALRARVRTIAAATAPAIVPYCAFVALEARPIFERLYGAAYGEHAGALTVYAVFYVVQWLSMILFAALSALELSRPIAYANLLAAAASSVVGVPLMLLFGVSGAVAAMTVGIAALTLSYWRTFRHTAVVG
jgi:O-antigen/teichoic acid export membrane protein